MIFLAPKPKYLDVRESDGVPIRRIGAGSYLFKRPDLDFPVTPWDVEVNITNRRVYIGKGYVNSLEPLLSGEPISGIYPDGAYSGERPFLPLGSGIQAVLLKITPNAAGNLDFSAPYLASEEALKVELGGLEEAAAYDPKQWIQPLALVSDGGKLAQLSCFNYAYKALKRKGNWRHALAAEPVFSRSIQDKIAAVVGGDAS